MRTLLGLVVFAACANGAGKVELVVDGLKEPFGFVFWQNDVLLTDFAGNRVVAITPEGKISVVAGSGKVGSADGIGEAASMNAPHNLAILPNGLCYIADTQGHKLRLLDPKTKKLSTLGGSTKGFSGDGGPISEAKFDQLYHVAFPPQGEVLFICDLGNRRIRKWDLKTNIITTVAGNGKAGVPKDGELAIDQPLVDPRAVEVDAKGRIWILERGGHALRVVEEGKIRTVVGTGKSGLSGDDGPGVKATLNGPKYLFITKSGTVLIADTENHCIREYDPETQIIKRVMGTGKKGLSPVGGDLLETMISRPHGVAVDAKGTLYVADSYNGRLLKVTK